MPVSWIDTIEEISNPALTVEAQTVPLPQEETFMQDALMPRENVDKTEIKGVKVRAIRPTSGRREWNGPGVTVEKPVPEEFEMNILPIEGRDQIDEKEYDELQRETINGGEARLRELLVANIPDRVRHIALANIRTLEWDTYISWLYGEIRQFNPQNRAQEISASFPWKADRIQTAATPLNDAGVNSYEETVAFIKEGVEEMGAIEGLMLRQPLLDVIRADAPTVNGKKLNLLELEAEIRSEIGQDFRFIVNRAWIEPRGVKTFLFPVPRMALVPIGGAVGKRLFAPVGRAIDAALAVPDAGIDVRDQGAFVEVSNGGRHWAMQVQLNSAPYPDKNRVWVYNSGVTG